eukprot:CAMPEP_0115320058 /NCGR_PEP_ID=MMETSP0270-20121206/80115_1 /TAXON_ID=71861 /ORGANISM="Scrippsiella trochoidea, Strain CCMP3099" /LENGTH=517 /DNA_ID=CAMNT_0002739829 /DNA_START=21 /DNA_END=1571 /DNA_ORIENTATION=-
MARAGRASLLRSVTHGDTVLLRAVFSGWVGQVQVVARWRQRIHILGAGVEGEDAEEPADSIISMGSSVAPDNSQQVPVQVQPSGQWPVRTAFRTPSNPRVRSRSASREPPVATAVTAAPALRGRRGARGDSRSVSFSPAPPEENSWPSVGATSSGPAPGYGGFAAARGLGLESGGVGSRRPPWRQPGSPQARGDGEDRRRKVSFSPSPDGRSDRYRDGVAASAAERVEARMATPRQRRAASGDVGEAEFEGGNGSTTMQARSASSPREGQGRSTALAEREPTPPPQGGLAWLTTELGNWLQPSGGDYWDQPRGGEAPPSEAPPPVLVTPPPIAQKPLGSAPQDLSLESRGGKGEPRSGIERGSTRQAASGGVGSDDGKDEGKAAPQVEARSWLDGFSSWLQPRCSEPASIAPPTAVVVAGIREREPAPERLREQRSDRGIRTSAATPRGPTPRAEVGRSARSSGGDREAAAAAAANGAAGRWSLGEFDWLRPTAWVNGTSSSGARPARVNYWEQPRG